MHYIVSNEDPKAMDKAKILLLIDKETATKVNDDKVFFFKIFH